MNNLIEVPQGRVRCTRNRGLIWRDGDTQKLLHVWSQPEIQNCFLIETRKVELYMHIAKELYKIGVRRRWEEIRAKIKNLKREFTKYRESGQPEKFKFYNLMDNIMKTAAVTKGCQLVNHFPQSNENQPIQIQLEIIPEQAFRSLQGHFPIQKIEVSDYNGQVFTKTEEDTNIENVHHTPQGMQFSQTSEIENEEMDSAEIMEEEYEVVTVPETDPLITECLNDNNDIPVIVYSGPSKNATSTSTTASTTGSPIFKSRLGAYKNFRKRVNTVPMKRLPSRETYHERKLKSISEKMAETVERILTQTTNSLLEEIKASEERYISWEENKRFEDQKREEKMFQRLMDAIKEKPKSDENSEWKKRNSEATDREREKDERERQRIKEMVQSADDPCTMTFDLLAANLTNRLMDQQKETEQTLRQWEAKMQRQELRHTENLFSMMITAVSSKDTNDFP